MKRKFRISKHFILFLALLTVFSAYIVVASIAPPDRYVDADVIEVSGSNLLVGHNCTAVIGAISDERAEYIRLGKEGKIEGRPNIYDVYKETLENFGIELTEVRIIEIKDGAYRSETSFSNGEKVLEIDSRPSDGIALALRTGSPIYISERLLKESGKEIC